MSLAINPRTISHVLLAGQSEWIEVDMGSFYIDSYEYVYPPANEHYHVAHGGGQGGITSSGFSFRENGRPGPEQISGPLTAIVAVKWLDD